MHTPVHADAPYLIQATVHSVLVMSLLDLVDSSKQRCGLPFFLFLVRRRMSSLPMYTESESLLDTEGTRNTAHARPGTMIGTRGHQNTDKRNLVDLIRSVPTPDEEGIDKVAPLLFHNHRPAAVYPSIFPPNFLSSRCR